MQPHQAPTRVKDAIVDQEGTIEFKDGTKHSGKISIPSDRSCVHIVNKLGSHSYPSFQIKAVTWATV